MVCLWAFLSLFPRSKGLMCLMSSVHIIADYMWLHETHARTHIGACLILKWSLWHVWKVSIFRWFALGWTLWEMVNHIYSWWASICANASCMQNQQYARWGHPWVKWRILKEHLCQLWKWYVSHNLCKSMSRSLVVLNSLMLMSRILLKGDYIMKISHITSLCMWTCNGVRGPYNLQD